MTIKITSGINSDRFDVDNKSFLVTEIAELKRYIGNQDVEFVKGRNVFLGEPISDNFFNQMIDIFNKEV